MAPNQSSSIGIQKIVHPGKMGLPKALEFESNLWHIFCRKMEIHITNLKIAV
jgi:hypothetical protein